MRERSVALAVARAVFYGIGHALILVWIGAMFFALFLVLE
jgi:hypothetical protein